MQRKRNDFDNIPNSRIEYIINEYIHKERDREILKRRFIDGITFEDLAAEFGMSPRHIQNIVYREGDKVLKRL